MTVTVVYAGTADGLVQSQATNGTYATARAGATLYAYPALTYADIGQRWWDDTIDTAYEVMESFLGFDTSAIGTDTISAAVLNVTSKWDGTTDFTIEARLRDWGATLTTADWVAGASLSGLTSLATKTTASGFTAGTAYDFTDVALPANIVKTGTTRMLLCSSRTTGNNAPTGDEYVTIKSADTAGTTSDPKLTVTHAAGGADTALIGSAAGAGAATSSITTAIRLAGTSAGVATAAGVLSFPAAALSGTAAGTSTAAGVLTTGVALTGTAAGAATATGVATTAIRLAGSAAGAGAVPAAALTTGISLAGSAAGAGAATGAITTGIALAGAVSGASTAAALLSTAIALAGTSAGGATAAGTLAAGGTAAALVGTSAGTGSAAGVLLTAIQMVGTSAGASTTAANLATAIALAGSSAGAASAAGALDAPAATLGLAARMRLGPAASDMVIHAAHDTPVITSARSI